MKLIISGHSDDIISVEGDISDEIPLDDLDRPIYVAISDGTLLRVSYDGMWTIRVMETGLDTKIHHEPATDEDTNYSDVVTVTGDWAVEWVVGGVGLIPKP